LIPNDNNQQPSQLYLSSPIDAPLLRIDHIPLFSTLHDLRETFSVSDVVATVPKKVLFDDSLFGVDSFCLQNWARSFSLQESYKRTVVIHKIAQLFRSINHAIVLLAESAIESGVGITNGAFADLVFIFDLFASIREIDHFLLNLDKYESWRAVVEARLVLLAGTSIMQ
jgi:hypothetical protein